MSFNQLRMGSLIKEVQENNPGNFKTPALPQPAAEGFPTPKKRVSAFKALRTVKQGSNTGSNPSQRSPLPPHPTHVLGRNGFNVSPERKQISEENNARIANMSPAEVARNRQEVLSSLSPSVIDMLMKRSNIDQDDQEEEAVFDKIGAPSREVPAPPWELPEIKIEDASQPQPAPRQPRPEPPPADIKSPSTAPSEVKEGETQEVADNRNEMPKIDDIGPEKPIDVHFMPNKTHFPRAHDIPELDPNDPNFLELMQQKYFPNLSVDAAQLAWMAPIPEEHSPADQESPYYPDQASLPISAIRFDFRGSIITPKKSREVPVTAGLHHHGEAPEAAGYTIAELGIYARSAVPAQRCVAFQTLGRILYRLGKGQWGKGDLASGIWSSVTEARIMDSLNEEAGKKNGHLSSQAYATEALWLYERGGWKKRLSGR